MLRLESKPWYSLFVIEFKSGSTYFLELLADIEALVTFAFIIRLFKQI